MLRRLTVKNYAIIKDLSMELDKGLIILTGETGSGKSILLGALGLIMGDRADTKVVFDEQEKCIVEAVIDISGYSLEDFFKENDLDYESLTIIRREINPGGKTRAFVNDTPVTLQILQELTSRLVDLHRQFDTLSISSETFQKDLLDALAGHQSDLQDYKQTYWHFQQILKELHLLRQREANALKEKEFFEFQYRELLDANLIRDELPELETENNLLTHAEDIKKQTGMVYHILEENERSIIGQLKSCTSGLYQFADMQQSLRQITERLDSSILELEDIAAELNRIFDLTEYDPERLSEINQRLDILYKLMKKHQLEDTNGLISLRDQLAQQIKGFENLAEDILKLESEEKKSLSKLLNLADKITKARKSVVPIIEKGVRERLAKLNMEHASIKIEIEQLQEPGSSGMDKIRFLFAANKGSAFRPIKEVASGGEMSRLALCIKSIAGKAQSLPTMIFDEIDTGVSGQVAQQMGTLLKGLSENHQVIVITHTPQVAARAEQHFLVFKEVLKDRTLTHIKEIAGDERIRMLAVMLSTDPPTKAALENAKELILSKSINT